MRAIKPNTRRRSMWRTGLLALAAIIVGGAGTVAALAFFRVVEPERLAFWRAKEKPDPRGLHCHSPLRASDSGIHGGHP